jgi:DNA-binding response OmpR family regulator
MADRILVVDDDRQLTEFLIRFLSKQGFEVASAGSATQMGLIMEHRTFDLLILDVGLPDVDGFEVTRQIRRSSDLPIILLTVRDEVYDKIVGLEIGADDYIGKPFEPHELLARIRAVLRRTSGRMQETAVASGRVLEFGGFRIDTGTRQVAGPDGLLMPLTSTEYALLVALVRRPGEAVTRDSLMDVLYGGSIHITHRAIDAHVVRLRRKITAAGGEKALIATVHGTGYVVAALVDQT